MTAGARGYNEDMRLAHVLADQADAISLERFRAQDLTVDTKPDLTPVTDADRRVEEQLRITLSRARTRDAVLRNLSRLGETTKFIPQSVQDRTPGVPWPRLRDIRNLLAHDYFGVDPRLICHTARVELPALRPALQALADAPGDDLQP